VNASGLRSTPLWKVWVVDDVQHDLHLLFTLVSPGRAGGVELTDDERDGLDAVVVEEIRSRGLETYEILVHVAAGQPMEVHLTADGPVARVCPGMELVDAADVRFVLDLAQAVKCPLCGHRVARWRIGQGVMDHEPGE
jgi:hypothetical protein